MKVFVLFALFAVPITSNLCAKEGANLAASAEIKAKIVLGAGNIFGHCYSLDFNVLLFGGDCLPLFEQAFCYGQLAEVRYGDLDVVNYGHLADDIPNIQHLGEVSCERGRGCFNSLRDAFNACLDDETIDDFVGVALNQIGKVYKEKGEELLKDFGMDEADTIIGELISLLRNRFQNVADVKQAIKDYLSEDIISDAKAAAKAIDDAAKAWCDDNCNVETGPFLEQLFNHMDGGNNCNDAAKFCGHCHRRANNHLVSNAVPCCLDNLINLSMNAVAYVRDQYDDLIEEFKAYLSGKLSEDAVKEALKIQKRVVKELGCLNESYEDSHNDCGPAA